MASMCRNDEKLRRSRFFSPTVVKGEAAVINIKQCTHTSVKKHYTNFQYECDIVSSASRYFRVFPKTTECHPKDCPEVNQISSKVFQRFKEVI